MHYNRIIFNMNNIVFLISFGWFVCISLAEIDPSNRNISHYACDTNCISRFSEDLEQCQSDTGESPECTAKELGEVLPLGACDYAKTLNSTAEELNEDFNNGRFVAYKWNTIRASLTKGPVSFKYIAEEDTGTVNNIEIIADTESSKFQCQYNFNVNQDSGRSQETRFYTVNDGNGTSWHWGWYFHSENVHIFRSCQVSPNVHSSESYGSIVVYVRVDHEEEGDEALQQLTFLKKVKFDKTIVQCV